MSLSDLFPGPGAYLVYWIAPAREDGCERSSGIETMPALVVEPSWPTSSVTTAGIRRSTPAPPHSCPPIRRTRHEPHRKTHP